jgi:hypothetical protein
MSDTIVKPMPYRYDLAQPLKKTYLDTVFATQDNEAHRFDISLYRDKAQLEMPSGAAVSAYFIRYSDNATIPLTGKASGSVVNVTLKKVCYNKPGQFAVIIKVTTGNVINTVFYGEGTMLVSSTDTYIDPENVIPSLEDLLAQIATMEEVTKDAKDAADTAKDAADAANEAAGHAPYVDETNNHWMTWDTESAKYIDTGVSATGPVGPQGPAGQNGTGAGTVTAVTVKGQKYEPDQTGNVDLGELGGGDASIDDTEPSADKTYSSQKVEEELSQLSEQKANKTGWAANKLIGTDANGNMVAQDPPEDNGGDADTLGGKEPKYYLQPRNLLDNSDFSNPVNQRGQETYAGTGFTYTIDRWRVWQSEAVLTVQDGYISTNAPIYQLVEEYKPNTAHTLAVKYKNGDLVVLSHTYEEGNSDGLGTEFYIVNNDERPRIRIGAGDIEWAALYEGEYTADNLPPYVPKGYAVELVECQRYYNKYGATANGLLTTGGTYVRVGVTLPTIMRVTPTILNATLTGVRAVSGTNTDPTVTDVSISSAIGNNFAIIFVIDKNSLTATNNTPLACYVNAEFSADL